MIYTRKLKKLWKSTPRSTKNKRKPSLPKLSRLQVINGNIICSNSFYLFLCQFLIDNMAQARITLGEIMRSRQSSPGHFQMPPQGYVHPMATPGRPMMYPTAPPASQPGYMPTTQPAGMPPTTQAFNYPSTMGQM